MEFPQWWETGKDVKYIVYFICSFWLTSTIDVDRYSDKYQTGEPKDGTIEWNPGERWFAVVGFFLIDWLGLK